MPEFKDVTLREGAQVPGATIPGEAGIAVIDALADLGVDCVELSFPRAEPRAEWYRHADTRGLRTAALARAIEQDIDAAMAVDPDEVEVLINSSDIQLRHALGKPPDTAREMVAESVEHVVENGFVASVTLMDAVRAETETLLTLARGAVDAGATRLTLADTTGTGTPAAVTETVETVVDAVGAEAAVAIHTHDDKGVATANAAAGVEAGATRVDATVAGIGERAGNAPLEEVAVLLAENGREVNIEREALVPVCRQVCDALGVAVPPAKAVIGDRVYRHESGMHTAAMLAEPATFEPFAPPAYGGSRDLRFGAGTGRGAVRALLRRVEADPDEKLVTAGLEALHAAVEERGEPLSIGSAETLLRKRVLDSDP